MLRLHVTGLPVALTDEDLYLLFAPFGTVRSARTIKDSRGRSIGFGIVEMSCLEEVEEILNTKDRISVAGRRPNIWRPSDTVSARSAIPSVVRVLEILLIEDNAGDARYTHELLKAAKIPIHLTVIKDGVEALALLHRLEALVPASRPDLILCDLNLPKLYGLEVLSEIRKDPQLKNLPVIVVTSSEATMDIHKSMALGVAGYMTKPLDVDLLLRLSPFLADSIRLQGPGATQNN